MLARFIHRVARTLADMQHAQHRATVLVSAPDRFVPNSNKAPGTYAEFLFRTSGPLLHEPPAAHRARGQLIR